ncbi:unannotated protein [freshwater metagenome]|uniref:Unannotated protein n=1 Tax=freshwater metagenome TaxID=449393 RepID=A0A6J6MA68_9ZZZZ|nr:hypothetical protein [Actinomycetota bacterium]
MTQTTKSLTRTGSQTRFRFTAILAVTLATGLAFAGCGGETKPDASKVGAVQLISSSVDAASQVETMRVAGDFSIASSGEPSKIALDGGIDFKNNSTSLKTSLGDLGIPGLDAAEVEIRLVGETAYIRVGDLIGGIGSALLGGKEWIAMDLSALGGESLASANPANLLATLRGIADVKKVGTDTVRGNQATHYTGIINLADALGAAPRADQKEISSAFENLSKEFPVDVWVDSEGRTVKLSTNGGSSENNFSFSLEFFDFGADLNISAPPSGDVGSLGGLGSGGNS